MSDASWLTYKTNWKQYLIGLMQDKHSLPNYTVGVIYNWNVPVFSKRHEKISLHYKYIVKKLS